MVFPGEGFDPQQTLQVHCDFLLLLLFYQCLIHTCMQVKVWLQLGAYRLFPGKLCLV